MHLKEKIKRLIKEKRGQASLVFSLALMLFLAIVFSVCFIFFQALILIQNVQNSSQIALDTYTSQTATIISDSVKNGNDLTDGVQTKRFEEMLENQLALDDSLSCYYDDGKLKYSIQEISLSGERGDKLETKAEITINYPLYFMGKEMTSINGTIPISSNYYLI